MQPKRKKTLPIYLVVFIATNSARSSGTDWKVFHGRRQVWIKRDDKHQDFVWLLKALLATKDIKINLRGRKDFNEQNLNSFYFFCFVISKHWIIITINSDPQPADLDHQHSYRIKISIKIQFKDDSIKIPKKKNRKKLWIIRYSLMAHGVMLWNKHWRSACKICYNSVFLLLLLFFAESLMIKRCQAALILFHPLSDALNINTLLSRRNYSYRPHKRKTSWNIIIFNTLKL